MEKETTQEQSNKAPTKTRIAAWMMIIGGIVWLMGLLIEIFSFKFESIKFESINLYLGLLIMRPIFLYLILRGLLIIILSYFLIMGKRWAWVISVVFLFILSVPYSIVTTPSIVFVLVKQGFINRITLFSITAPIIGIIEIVSLILLLLDRKFYRKKA